MIKVVKLKSIDIALQINDIIGILKERHFMKTTRLMASGKKSNHKRNKLLWLL